MGDPPMTSTLLQVRYSRKSEDPMKRSTDIPPLCFGNSYLNRAPFKESSETWNEVVKKIHPTQAAAEHDNKEAVLLLLEHGFVPFFLWEYTSKPSPIWLKC